MTVQIFCCWKDGWPWSLPFLFLTDVILYVAPCPQFRRDNSINPTKAYISKPSLFVWEICIIKLPHSWRSSNILCFVKIAKWNIHSFSNKAITLTRCLYSLRMEMFHAQCLLKFVGIFAYTFYLYLLPEMTVQCRRWQTWRMFLLYSWKFSHLVNWKMSTYNIALVFMCHSKSTISDN